MEQISYVPILLCFVLLLLFYQQNQIKKMVIAKQIVKNKKGKEKTKMFEIAKNFIGKDCIIYTFNSQVNGIIKEVSEGSILVDNQGSLEALNLEYIVRIREYPLNKKGKRKAIVTD